MELTFLQILWFILITVLWIGYVALEGFDFGVGMLLKILPKNARERRLALNTIGPHWDGNEVWLLTAGGATFAAFPEWYATMFSGMYLALVVILLLLIIRIVAIEWRSKINTPSWANTWDTLHMIAAWGVSILWGVAFANLVQGMKIEVGTYTDGAFVAADKADIAAALAAGNQHYLTGGFFSLLTPFTILGGVVTTTLFLAHGAMFLAIKTEGEFHDRAVAAAKKLSLVATAVTAVWALWGQFAYSVNTWSLIPLALAAVLLIGSFLLINQNKDKSAFFVNFAAIAFAVVFIFSTFYPNALKSSIDPAYNLTLVQASATGPTQTVMTIAAVVFVPIVVLYTAWSYKAFSKRMSVENVPVDPAGLDPKKIRSFETA